MAAITLRATKGSELTHSEVDNNFYNLNLGLTSAVDITGGSIGGVAIDAQISADNNIYYACDDTGGIAKRMLGISSTNQAFIGPVDNGGPDTAIFNYGNSMANVYHYIGGSVATTLNATGLGIGTAPVSGAKLEVLGNIVSRDSKTVSATSNGRLMGGAYTGNLATMLYLRGTSGSNSLNIGGGTTVGEPATSISFSTGTAGTLNAGTTRLTISSTGRVTQNSAVNPLGSNVYLHCRNANGTSNSVLQIDYTGGGGGAISSNTGAGLLFYSHTGAIGSESSTETARLTTTGLSIGTTADPTSTLSINGSAAFKPPVTVTASLYSPAVTDYSIIFNTTATCSLTLPAAPSYPGRILYLKNAAAFAINSSTSVIIPLTSASTPGTSILPATAGKWVMLHCDGTYWHVMAGN